MFVCKNDYRNEICNINQSLDFREGGGSFFKDYPFITMGRRSYLEGSTIQAFPPAHILIGHYTSVADEVSFIVNADHDKGSIANYTLFRVGPEFASPLNTNIPFVSPAPCQIIIGNDVWIGSRSTIMGGVHIGNGAVVAAGSVVVRDVPPYAIVGGNPAKVLRYRFSDEWCKKIDSVKWWYWQEKEIRQNAEFIRTPEEFIKRFWKPYMQCDSLLRQKIKRSHRNTLLGILVDADVVVGEKVPIWEHVYDVLLDSDIGAELLLIITPSCSEESLVYLKQKLKTFDPDGPWRVVEIQEDFRQDLLQELDGFVIGRDYRNIEWVDWSNQSGTELYYGLDHNPLKI